MTDNDTIKTDVPEPTPIEYQVPFKLTPEQVEQVRQLTMQRTMSDYAAKLGDQQRLYMRTASEQEAKQEAERLFNARQEKALRGTERRQSNPVYQPYREAALGISAQQILQEREYPIAEEASRWLVGLLLTEKRMRLEVFRNGEVLFGLDGVTLAHGLQIVQVLNKALDEVLGFAFIDTGETRPGTRSITV